MNKKLMILAILLVAAIALVGCTPKTPAATATPIAEPTATVEPVVEATPEAKPEVTPEVAEAAADNALKGRKADVLVDYTLEELSKFDGKEGRLSYVAVDGIVYDVSESKAWKDGEHSGFQAGKDLTEEIKKSPHGIEAMDNVIEVGKLVTK